MTYCASPDAPGEVLARRARRRADGCAEGYRAILDRRTQATAERAERRRLDAANQAARERARSVAASPLDRLTASLTLPPGITAMADQMRTVSDNLEGTFLGFSRAAATCTAEHADDCDNRAARQAAAAEALAALVPADLALADELADLDAATWPLTGLDLPPPGRLIRCQPMAAHAPPTALAPGRSRRWDKGTPLETVGGT
jgi:hypothetical protein